MQKLEAWTSMAEKSDLGQRSTCPKASAFFTLLGKERASHAKHPRKTSVENQADSYQVRRESS